MVTRIPTQIVQPQLKFLGSRKVIVEKLWRQFFSDPSEWWDYRVEKLNPRYPDFKHKKSQDSLWLNGRLNPPWVARELAAMAAGTVQSPIFSWNKKLARYVKAGQYETALELFRQMEREGMIPDEYTFVPVINACASRRALEDGRRIHEQVIQRQCESDMYVGSSLVYMYAKCGSILDAEDVFDKMPVRNVVSWNVMVNGHVKCGQWQKALGLLERMQREGIEPDRVTFVGFLSACAGSEALKEGKAVHEQIVQKGCESDVFVCNSLIDMYGKCGSIEDAKRVFCKLPKRDVVSWNAMIVGYVRCGQGQEALDLFKQMRLEGMEPDRVTFVGMLNACACLEALQEARLIHGEIIQVGLETDVFVGSSLIDMYGKCGSIEDAREVFDKLPTRNVVCWTSIIQGYMRCGQGQKAMELSRQMLGEGLEPDSVTFVGFLNTCASLAALKEGRRVHEQIVQAGCESNVSVGNSLIDMYAKCGSINDALTVFKKMPERDGVSWNTMLGSYAMHGRVSEALGHFQQMCQANVDIDAVTFVSLLSACSHAGLVDEGVHYFECMVSLHGISATLEHYACMVDLLGRAGHLHEAENLMRRMSCVSSAGVWMSLLGACKHHVNVNMGERIMKHLLKLDPEDASCYVLLSNMYAGAGNWDRRDSIQRLRLERNVKKAPGCS